MVMVTKLARRPAKGRGAAFADMGRFIGFPYAEGSEQETPHDTNIITGALDRSLSLIAERDRTDARSLRQFVEVLAIRDEPSMPKS